MSDIVGSLCALAFVIFMGAVWLLGVAWVTLLPAIGLLWCLGWLP